MRSSIGNPTGSRFGGDGPRSLHESLIELLPDAMLALDIESGRFVLANMAAERLLGVTRAQLSRLGLRDLVRPWDVAQLGRVEAALATEGQWRGELWLKRQDGTFVPVDVAAQAWDLDGRMLAQFCCREMSARWRNDAMRQVISHAAERLAATVDDREALWTVVTAALPGLADAALVELAAVDGDDPVAVAAFADPAAPAWPGLTVDEAPTPAARDAIRRGSALAVPLVVNGRRIGTLTLRRDGPRRWNADDRPLVEELANHAAHAIDQARQWSSARQELNDRAAMQRILSAIATDVTPRRVFELVLEEAQAALQADDGGAARWHRERGVLVGALPKPGADPLCVVDSRLMVAVSASERCALIENDYQRTMGRDTPAGRVGAWAVMSVPVVHGDTAMGGLWVSHIASARPFRQSDARRLELLASAGALALAGMAQQSAFGARLAVSEAAHLLNNDLAVTMGSLDLMRLSDDLAPTLVPLVDMALDGLSQAADHLAQLQRLRRIETFDGPLGPRLDLARSTGQNGALPAH